MTFLLPICYTQKHSPGMLEFPEAWSCNPEFFRNFSRGNFPENHCYFPGNCLNKIRRKFAEIFQLTTYFSYAWVRPWSQFLATIVTFSPIWKVISPLNSGNISTSKSMDHIKFRIILFIWVWILYLGYLISGGLDPQKSASLQCTISIGTTNLLENVSCRPCAGHLKFRRFGSGSAHARNFWNVSRRQSSLTWHVWVCCWQRVDQLYCIWLELCYIMAHLGITENRVFTFCLHAPIGVNWTHKTPCNNRFHPVRSASGKMAVEKPAFRVIMEDGNASWEEWPPSEQFSVRTVTVFVKF